jgi:long-chain acyl-CoA synthetase
MDQENAALAQAAVVKRLTIPTLFFYVTGRFSNPEAFMERAGDSFEPIPLEVFRRMVIEISLGLEASGVRRGDPVALISENRIEWAASDLAISCLGAVTVPLSPLLAPSQFAHTLENSGARHAFVSTGELAEIVFDCFGGSGTDHSIFLIEGKPVGKRDTTLEDLAAIGREQLPDGEQRFTRNALAVDKDDLSTIMYTSGTSGTPKGARLSHRNIVSNVISVSSVLRVTSEDRCLSFLPLSHAFERTAGFLTIFYSGASIAYAESVHTLMRDLKEVSPTILVSVPRLYEKIAQTMQEEAAGSTWPLGLVFDRAMKLAGKVTRCLASGRDLTALTKLLRRLADLIIYKKIKAALGGKVRLCISGGAALDKEISETLYGCGLPIMEGYGLTEASPICCVNRLESFRFGSVGLPLPGVSVKISGNGEILVKGENVMMGYQKREDESRRTIKDGWLHTGDCGVLDDEGFLFITGRKKELIVTSWGVKVAPTPLEQKIKRSPYIKDLVIVGNDRPFCAALIVLDLERVAGRPGFETFTVNDQTAICCDRRVIDLIRSEIDRLSSFLSNTELIKKFCLLPREFSIEKGEMTTTYKPVRSVIQRNYAEKIESLYVENS